MTTPFDPNKSSRNIDDLIMPVKAMCLNHIHVCKLAGIDLLITQTYRSPADQNALFAEGRTAPGHIVTRAKAGQSMHQYRVAYDVVPLRNGKPVWDLVPYVNKAIWQQVGAIGKAQGLEWAGDWIEFQEYPHFQYTGGLSIAELAAGQIPVYPKIPLEKAA